jgi:hypothetical protein
VRKSHLNLLALTAGLPEGFRTGQGAVPRTAEYRVIGDPVLNAELAEPSVAQIDLDFAAQPALRVERSQQSASGSSAPGQSRELLESPTQIEQTVNLPHQMIGRNYLVEIK